MKIIRKFIVSMLYPVKQVLDGPLIRLSVLNGFFAGLYYTFFSTTFYKEHRAVLAGRIRYKKESKGDGSSSVLLRRNIHRMEKGLIMRPRRPVFARTYIVETVEAYRVLLNECNGECSQREELQWAHDVLAEFFEVTDESSSEINQARAAFASMPNVQEGKQLKPYKRVLTDAPNLSYSDMLELARHRRSVRWYEQKSVPREIVDKAMVVAGFSPSACNRQPFEFRIFDDPDLIKSVSSIPMGTKGFSENFPGIIAVVGKLSAYFHDRDKHVIYIDASLAAMSFVYALEVQGVSSCIINWPDIPKLEKRMEKVLGLQTDERVVMLISYGYPDPEGLVPYSQKKPLYATRTYNKIKE